MIVKWAGVARWWGMIILFMMNSQTFVRITRILLNDSCSGYSCAIYEFTCSFICIQERDSRSLNISREIKSCPSLRALFLPSSHSLFLSISLSLKLPHVISYSLHLKESLQPVHLNLQVFFPFWHFLDRWKIKGSDISGEHDLSKTDLMITSQNVLFPIVIKVYPGMSHN